MFYMPVKVDDIFRPIYDFSGICPEHGQNLSV